MIKMKRATMYFLKYNYCMLCLCDWHSWFIFGIWLKILASTTATHTSTAPPLYIYSCQANAEMVS